VFPLAAFQFLGAFLFSRHAGYISPLGIEVWFPFIVNCWLLLSTSAYRPEDYCPVFVSLAL
jgi:hypothetical protein